MSIGSIAGYDPFVRVGETIAGYDIVAKMKSGGMAALYLGRRSRAGGFEKHVAIKVVHEHLSEDKEFTRMFLDEARISASIEHPNVVHVHDLGSAEGRDFMVMEYVPGTALSQLIRALRTKKRRPTAAIASWMTMQVAAGLHAAHELTNDDGAILGVVHRDVSPKNVLIAFKGYVKLIDFGIAKAADRIHHTQGPLLKGTFRYMSPEQAVGSAVDRRTDVYALGIILWETLTLRRLFDAENDILLLDLVRNPSVPAPSSVAPDIPAALDAVVLKALAKNPDDRYPTAAAFRAAVAQACPESLAVTQAEVADLVGFAMQGHVQGHEDPSVQSALGMPKTPSVGASERLTRDVTVSLVTTGAVALAPENMPAQMTPTPHSVMSGVVPARPQAPTGALEPTLVPTTPASGSGKGRIYAVAGAVVLAVGLGVGGALMGGGGEEPHATPLAPLSPEEAAAAVQGPDPGAQEANMAPAPSEPVQEAEPETVLEPVVDEVAEPVVDEGNVEPEPVAQEVVEEPVQPAVMRPTKRATMRSTMRRNTMRSRPRDQPPIETEF